MVRDLQEENKQQATLIAKLLSEEKSDFQGKVGKIRKCNAQIWFNPQNKLCLSPMYKNSS